MFIKQVLANALYCNYFLSAMLQASGLDVLFEQHGSRITDRHAVRLRIPGLVRPQIAFLISPRASPAPVAAARR